MSQARGPVAARALGLGVALLAIGYAVPYRHAAAAPAARVRPAAAANPKKPTASRGANAMSTQAKLDRTKPPKLPQATRPKLPKLQRQKLANGLELDVIEMHKAPVVDVTLIVGAGASRDPADLPGLATFAAGMLDEGAGNRTALEIAEEIDYLGASLSSSAGPEVAQINMHAPKSGLPGALDVFADVILRPAFPDSEITRQRDLRKTGLIQLRDQPTMMAPLAFNAVLFGSGHPYGRPIGGNDASTALLDRARVTDFYKRFYLPGNARLLVVGDITPDEARSLVEARFGGWAGGDVPAYPAATAPPAATRAFYLVDKPGAPQSVVRIGNVGVPRSTPDYYAIEVLNTLLGGSFTSRLNQNLRETHGYTYGAGSGFDMRRMAGPFRASASVATGVTDSSVVQFLLELRRVRDEPVPQAELEKAQQLLTLGLPGEFETSASTAQQFVDLLVNDLPADTWDHYVDGINAVTAADVRRVARQYIDPDHFVMVVVGDRKEIEAGLKTLNEGPIQVRDLWGAEVRP